MRFNIYMQVQSIQNHFLYNYSSSTAFKGSVAITKASAAAAKGLTELKHIYAGTYGTYLEGSRALTDFFSCMAPNIRENIVKRGLSTNIDSVANCFLKSKWDNPISTSGVFDCSVLYLANEKTQTHFLYHMFKDVDYAKIQKIIKQFMPEGFTQAAIVPGDKKYIAEHKIVSIQPGDDFEKTENLLKAIDGLMKEIELPKANIPAKIAAKIFFFIVIPPKNSY